MTENTAPPPRAATIPPLDLRPTGKIPHAVKAAG